MSQREAAKALGVSHQTIMRDTAGPKSDESGPDRTTKAERRVQRERELASKQAALPSQRYGVIVADPEWRSKPYSRKTATAHNAKNHSRKCRQPKIPTSQPNPNE
jgi:hypothetical protein